MKTIRSVYFDNNQIPQSLFSNVNLLQKMSIREIFSEYAIDLQECTRKSS